MLLRVQCFAHILISLSLGDFVFRRKPFTFFNMGFQNKELRIVVSSTWVDFNSYSLWDMLNLVKLRVRRWQKNTYYNFMSRLKSCEEELSALFKISILGMILLLLIICLGKGNCIWNYTTFVR